MKTRQILTAMIVMAGFCAQAQVAVGTTNPQGAFHVDGASDNESSGAPTAVQQANDFLVTATGNVGIGTTAPGAKLEVKGAAVNSAVAAVTTATIDFSLGNLASTSSTATSITLNNLKNGGAYTLISTGSATTAVTFTGSSLTYKYMGTSVRTTGKTHIYSIIVVGTVGYVTMATEN